jgi:hypothetical protein
MTGSGMMRMSAWRLAGMTLCACTLVLALATTSVGASVARAKGGALNTYSLSGAVTGTLHDGANSVCPYGGINNKGFVELTDLVGSTSGIKGVISWSLDVTVKKNGTYTFKALSVGAPTASLDEQFKGSLTGSIEKGVQDTFQSHGGTVTVKGDSGSIDATMSQVSGKSLKLVARWDCGATAAQEAVAGHGWKLASSVTTNKVGTASSSGSSSVDLSSVSCPTTTFCAAVDQTGTAFTWNGKAWAKGVAIDSAAASNQNNVLDSVSCASPSFCMAGDDLSDVYRYDGTSWSAADQLNPSETSPSLTFSVSCPTTSFCMAVDGSNANAYTFNGSSWSQPQVIDPDTLDALVNAELSCASAQFCEAVYNDKSVTYNGSGWSAPITIPQPPGTKNGANAEVDTLSCPTSTFCAAGGTTGANVAYADTFNGTSWAKGEAFSTTLGPQMLGSLSCPTPSFCMAGGLDGWVTYNGSTWSKPQTFADAGGPIGTGPLYANAMSCPSKSFCEEVQSEGYADSWTG